MASATIPPSIILLQTVSEAIGEWIDWVQPDAPEFEAVQSGLHGNITPEYIVIVQTCLIATLTMFEGVGTPSIVGVSTTDETVTVRWAGGTSDTITWGEDDASFQRFTHYVASKVLGMPPQRDKQAIPPGLLVAIVQRFGYYLSALTITEDRITALVHSNVSKTFDGKVDPVFLFVVLSCLPLDQLNALFLYIQRFLPDDLTIKGPTGAPINVSQLFQPASDARFMVEKTNLYLDLFTNANMPIIREITLSKTIAYFEQLMTTPSVKEGVIENLKGIILYQISPRTQLYTVILRIINQIQK